MLYGHAVSALLAPRYQTGVWFDVWQFQRGLTSSLFLLLAGFAFSIATSKHWASHLGWSAALVRRLRRFALFVLLGYALHLPVAQFRMLPDLTTAQRHAFLGVDVLQLIGVTFIGVQLLVLVTRSRMRFAVVALGLAGATLLLTPLVWSVDWQARLPLWLAAYFSQATGSLFPLFRSQYIVTKVPQITNIRFWRSWRGEETRERFEDSEQAYLRAIRDAGGRIMVVMTFNTDIADSWEREGEDPGFFYQFSPNGYALGINVLLHAMTH